MVGQQTFPSTFRTIVAEVMKGSDVYYIYFICVNLDPNFAFFWLRYTQQGFNSPKSCSYSLKETSLSSLCMRSIIAIPVWIWRDPEVKIQRHSG